jgi:hypothetical protein
MGASERGPASIAEAFVRNAERAPEKLCLRFEGEEISYQGLRERAEGFGAGTSSATQGCVCALPTRSGSRNWNARAKTCPSWRR